MENQEVFKTKAVCVFDIGGTHFRCGIFENGELNKKSVTKNKTPNFNQFTVPQLKVKIVERICDSYIQNLKKYTDLHLMAISFPGPVSEDGIVSQSGVIFGKYLNEPFDLKTEIVQYIKSTKVAIPGYIKITNDVTASAWRYSDYGYDPFCIITVSSGIGNKIFSNNKVLIGSDGLAGEIGHHSVPLENFSKPCFCGWGNNHIGSISSGWGIEQYAKEFAQKDSILHSCFMKSEFGEISDYSIEEINNENIAKYADKGDVFTRKVIDFCTMPLADAIRLLCVAMYLKKIILIGGFALNCEYYRESLINNVIKKRIYNFSADEIRKMIILGEHDDFHALIGLGKMIDNEN